MTSKLNPGGTWTDATNRQVKSPTIGRCQETLTLEVSMGAQTLVSKVRLVVRSQLS